MAHSLGPAIPASFLAAIARGVRGHSRLGDGERTLFGLVNRLGIIKCHGCGTGYPRLDNSGVNALMNDVVILLLLGHQRDKGLKLAIGLGGIHLHTAKFPVRHQHEAGIGAIHFKQGVPLSGIVRSPEQVAVKHSLFRGDQIKHGAGMISLNHLFHPVQHTQGAFAKFHLFRSQGGAFPGFPGQQLFHIGVQQGSFVRRGGNFIRARLL